MKSKPILVIDDEEKFARMLQDILAGHGYPSDVCLNPLQGLDMLRNGNYELVVSDYKMPEMDGAEFLQEAHKINPDLPVIMISGLMNMPELIKVANIGVTLVLEKPFDTDDFLVQVARFVTATALFDDESQKISGLEASELNYSADNDADGELEWTFPRPAQHLAVSSTENGRFLESIWRNFGTSRHLVFYAAKGSEIRLVAREILGWMEADPDKPVVLLDLLDTKSNFTRRWLEDEIPFPLLLVVDLRGMGWNAESRVVLREWIEYLETFGEAIGSSRILYAIPTGTKFRVEDLQLNNGLAESFSADCPVLLSLRDRIMDVAAYTRKILGEENCARLPEAARLLLLHYSWPGGYAELQTKLAEILAWLESGETVGTDRIRRLLVERSDDPACLDAELTLESFLKRRQREYVQLLRGGGEDIRETLVRIGESVQGSVVEDVLNERILLYPAVLNEESGYGA